MYSEENIYEFAACIEDLYTNDTVRKMKNISQHIVAVSCFEHCLYVSFVSFVICKKTGLNYKSAARGAMLHDLYLKNWNETDVGLFKRLLVHPKMALENAKQFNPSELEQDIILRHMFPLTPIPPKTREGLVVCMVDTFCAGAEMIGFPGALLLARRMEAIYADAPVLQN